MSVASGGVLALAEGLDRVAANAEPLDRAPRFPSESLDALTAAGALAGAGPVREQWAAVRAVAAADGSVARILDGHLNAIERIDLLAPEPLRAEHLAAVERGELRLGVWGADPAPGEGEPARLDRGGESVTGTKVFCSGAGGVGGALVLVRGDAPGPPLLAWVDLESGGVEVDRAWYRAAGMRASESHRVVFDGAPVHALLGPPGALGAEPWFGRDALRTAACWAGLIDAVREEALAGLRERPPDDQLAALAAGRLVTIAGTVDAWFERAAEEVDRERADGWPPRDGARESGAPIRDLSIALRSAVAEAGRATVAQALAALGSRPLARGGRLDRSRRDLEVFLNQHRLDPLLARLGRSVLDA